MSHKISRHGTESRVKLVSRLIQVGGLRKVNIWVGQRMGYSTVGEWDMHIHEGSILYVVGRKTKPLQVGVILSESPVTSELAR